MWYQSLLAKILTTFALLLLTTHISRVTCSLGVPSSSVRSSNDSIYWLTVVGDDCLFVYSTSLTVGTRRSSTDHNTTVVFDTKPDATGSQCWNYSSNSTRAVSESGLLKLNYENGSITLNISLTLSPPYSYNNSKGWWAVTDGSAELDAGDESGKYALDVSDLYSENKFSYSCSNLVVTSLKPTNTTPGELVTSLTLKFTRFQLQPFANPRGVNNSVFVASFDCETWFTLPLWMGIITLLVFATILYHGVYFLSQISTNDRFENPKGKPLIITNFEE